MAALDPHEVIFEYKQIGSIVRVTAIDPATGTEVTFQAPAATSRWDLQNTAMRKLRYVLQKQSGKPPE